MYKYDAITKERLEILDDGKCYLDQDCVSLRTQLYEAEQQITCVQRAIPPKGKWHDVRERRVSFSSVVTDRTTNWESVSLPVVHGPTWLTAWFRIVVNVPPEWRDRDVHLLIDTGSEALLFNDEGIPLQGLLGSDGDDRRCVFVLPYHLPEAVYYIEAAANHMFGAGCGGMIQPPSSEEFFSFKQASIALPLPKAWLLLRKFQALRDCVEHLSEPAKSNALYVANAVSSLCNVREPRTWDRCIELCEEYFQGSQHTKHRVYAVGHCHIDTETRRKCARSWSSQLAMMEGAREPGDDKDAPFSFCASSAQQYSWLKEDYPTLFCKIKEAVKRGTFQPVGGTWVEFDGNLPSGEAMVRQFLYGQRFFEEEFGALCSEFFMPDTFGYSAQLPQIMRKSGIRRFLSQKLSWNLMNKFPHNTFIWKGLDRSGVLAHFPPADTYNAKGTIEDVMKSHVNNRDVGRCPASLMLFGFGDGGGGPTPEMLARMGTTADAPQTPQLLRGESVSAFFDDAEKHSQGLCTWIGELYLELHRGTYTSQARTKRRNRELQRLLFEVEALCSMATLMTTWNVDWVERLNACWRLVLLNQFHDVLPGTSIALVYEDVHEHYDEVEAVLRPLRSQALEQLYAGKDEEITVPSMFNALSVSREEVVKGPGGDLLLVSAGPLSLARPVDWDQERYGDGVSVCKNDDENVFVMENKFARVMITPFGSVTSYVLKNSGRECVAEGQLMNVFTLYDDIPFFWDAWDTMPYHLETRQVLDRVTGEANVLENDRYRGELQCEAEWREDRKLLKVEFPTSVYGSSTCTYETQFGHIERPSHQNTSWDVAKFEVCAQSWACVHEYGFGIAVLNDGKHGYSCRDNVLSHTLLKAPKAPDAGCDMGKHSFRYCVMPFEGSPQSAGVIERAMALNAPLIQCSVAPNVSMCECPIAFSAPGIYVTAVKLCEDNGNDLVIRAYEGFGRSVTTSLELSDAWGSVERMQLVDMLERDCGQEVNGDVGVVGKMVSCGSLAYCGGQRCTIAFTPFAVHTVRIQFRS